MTGIGEDAKRQRRIEISEMKRVTAQQKLDQKQGNGSEISAIMSPCELGVGTGAWVLFIAVAVVGGASAIQGLLGCRIEGIASHHALANGFNSRT